MNSKKFVANNLLKVEYEIKYDLKKLKELKFSSIEEYISDKCWGDPWVDLTRSENIIKSIDPTNNEEFDTIDIDSIEYVN